MLEAQYQARVIRRLRTRFPGCVILKNDPDYIQGIPDLTVLHGRRWVEIEIKPSAKAALQPNQRYYLDMFNEMSFATIIHPDNEQDMFDEIQYAFEH